MIRMVSIANAHEFYVLLFIHPDRHKGTSNFSLSVLKP